MSSAATVDAPRAESLPSWNLADYYERVDDPRVEKDLADADRLAGEFAAAYRGKVAGLSTAELAGALAKLEAIFDCLYRPAIYGSLLYAADATKAEHGKLVARTREAGAKSGEKLVFFDLELTQIPADKMKAILASAEIAPYRNYIQRELLKKDHRLSEIEERLLAKFSPVGHGAWARMFHEILDHQKYHMAGEEKPMSFSEVSAFLYSPDRAKREACALAISKGLEGLQKPLVFLFNTILLDHKIDDEARGYKTPMDSRNASNETTLASVIAMLDACDEAAPRVSERYYRLKGKLLGVEKPMDYDRYAPLPGAGREMGYDDARELILRAFRAFSPEFADLTVPFFEKHWIDADLREGKSHGAFCSGGVPGVHSYILMSYTRKMADVKTLAHELGHGVHFELSRRNSLLVMDPTICLAETASVFAERLVLEELLNNAADPKEKLAILCNELEQSFATVFRQAGFTRFEWDCHNARRAEGELSADRINEIWMKTGRVMFGDALTLGDHYKIWWSYIGHFIHTPFYCYGYAFGKLLVLALYQLYRERGESFVPQYMELLARGGSATPEELLAPLGVDLGDPAFWSKGLKVMEEMVDEAERLAANL